MKMQFLCCLISLLCGLQRLSIAKEFGDKAAERRAYSNLGNALIFLGQFNAATEYYRWGESAVWHLVERFWYDACHNLVKCKKKYPSQSFCCSSTHSFWFLVIPLFLCRRKTLQLSRQLRDQVMEAQACYSLGNTCTLLQQYERAIDYHLKHLCIAQQLNDR